MIAALGLVAGSTSIDLDDPNEVSPGILGFLAFALLAVALYFLVRSMNGHLRRVRYRQEDLDRAAEAEAHAQAAGESAPQTAKVPDDGSPAPAAPPTPPEPPTPPTR